MSIVNILIYNLKYVTLKIVRLPNVIILHHKVRRVAGGKVSEYFKYSNISRSWSLSNSLLVQEGTNF